MRRIQSAGPLIGSEHRIRGLFGMVITLPVRALIVATPRSRIIQLDLQGQSFTFRAGQSSLIGIHDEPSRRKPYSMASAPEEANRHGWLEFLVQVDERGSPGPHLEGLKPGMLVDVEGPLGSFQFPERPEERRFVFIAGGTGIAPLRAMLWHALLAGHDGHLGVVYSVRTPDEFAYAGELQGLAAQGRIDFRQTVTRAAPSEWSGRVGRIDAEYLAPLIDHAPTLCFVCGPPALVQDIPSVLQQLGVTADRIRMEQWE